VAGPAAFVAAWSALGTGRPGYSPINDPISRLAAQGAPSRPAMTAGLVVFGMGVSLYASELCPALGRAPALSVASSALGTFGIALTPLGSVLGGCPHAACAGLAYLGLAATPILAGRRLAAEGRRGAAAISAGVGVASGASLLASTFVGRRAGLAQRIGLSIGDAWIMATAAWLIGRRPRLWLSRQPFLVIRRTGVDANDGRRWGAPPGPHAPYGMAGYALRPCQAGGDDCRADSSGRGLRSEYKVT
jgi:hypothetical protein